MKKTKINFSLILIFIVLFCAVYEKKVQADSYAQWSQSDQLWANAVLAPGTDTMKQSGCVVTALAMLMVQSGVKSENNFDPGVLCQLLVDSKAFNENSCIYWNRISTAVPEFELSSTVILSGDQQTKAETIKEKISKGYSVLVSVENSSHWVVVKEISGDQINGYSVEIMDPGYKSRTNLFESYKVSGVNKIVLFKSNISQKIIDETSEDSTEFENTEETLTEIIPDVSVTYKTHVQNIGWQENVFDGELSGTQGRALRLEGIEISVSGNNKLGIKYRTHIQNIGWQDYVSNGLVSGTTGQSLRLEGIKIELTGEDADKYNIYYSVHVQDYGWLGWAKNGEMAGTIGLSKRLEAIKIFITPKDEIVDVNSEKTYVSAYGNGEILYSTHIQSIGWQGYKEDGALSGTEGQSLRLEGIKIRLGENLPEGSVNYQTHVQDYGWMSYVSDGDLSGTTGKYKRLEAIKINLSGEILLYYDIYYRVHIQDYGWLGWAKNGEMAGSSGCSRRLEAIEIRLVPKDTDFLIEEKPSSVIAGNGEQ